MKKLLCLIALLFIFAPTSLAFGQGSFQWESQNSLKALDLLRQRSVTRFWSDTYKGHFYTADPTEASYVDSTYSDNVWRNEGEVFDVYNPLICFDAPPGYCMPVYRFWSTTYKHHFYTISLAEKNNIIANMSEWSYEGVAYAASSVNWNEGRSTIPLYRFWSDTYKGHFYTTSESERDNIAANMPEWRYEGVAYYVTILDYVISP